MKYLKTYENINRPQIGDYVVCELPIPNNPKFDYDKVVDFVNNNVGRIEKIESGDYLIRYYNIPLNIRSFFVESKDNKCRSFEPDKLKFISKNKEHCELYISKKKYNL